MQVYLIQIYNIIDSSNDTIVSAYLINLRSDAMVMEKTWPVLDQVYCWTSVGQQTKSDPILSTMRGIEWVEIFLWGLCRARDFEFRCFHLLFWHLVKHKFIEAIIFGLRNHLHIWSSHKNIYISYKLCFSSTPEPLFTADGYWITTGGACVFAYALW